METTVSPGSGLALPGGSVCTCSLHERRTATPLLKGIHGTPSPARRRPAADSCCTAAGPPRTTPNTILNGRRLSALSRGLHEGRGPHLSPTTTAMIVTKTCIVPKSTEHEIIENVALDAFDPIKAIVEEEYDDATFEVVDEDGPAFTERGFIPFPHLRFSVTADEEVIDEITRRIDRPLYAVVTRFTRTLAAALD